MTIYFHYHADLMKSIIRETVFAVSQQETRPILTGVHWEAKDGGLSCVATDSHRLARRLTVPEEMPERTIQHRHSREKSSRIK